VRCGSFYRDEINEIGKLPRKYLEEYVSRAHRISSKLKRSEIMGFGVVLLLLQKLFRKWIINVPFLCVLRVRRRIKCGSIIRGKRDVVL
jgi:hypothetical protein